MALYSCPRCLHETNKLCRMICHFERTRPCKLKRGGILLTNEIKEAVLCKSYVLEETANKTPNITLHFINTRISELYATVPFVGKSTGFEHEDIDITDTQDQTNLADAYSYAYSYDHEKNNYIKRMDRCGHNWFWQKSTFDEIFTDITEQIRRRVFIPYEIVMNNDFANQTIDTNRLKEFYKISQYLLIKPLCCEAKHDNELLHKRSSVEYFELTDTHLRDTLCNIFVSTQIDVWEMAKFRDNIKTLIETNAETTFKKIKELICRSLVCLK